MLYNQDYFTFQLFVGVTCVSDNNKYQQQVPLYKMAHDKIKLESFEGYSIQFTIVFRY